jgi:ATP-binding cassette, subfamily D (ALD), peroxisomal long-chain fatty acid import protein
MLEDFIIKYSWSAVGLIIASIPVFFPGLAGARTRRIEAQIDMDEQDVKDRQKAEKKIYEKKTGSRTQGFITNKRLMISLADAGGRVM